jgi:hypothetical protein
MKPDAFSWLGEVPTAVRALVYLGVPSVIALFLVYSMAGALAVRLASIEEKVDAHEAQRARDTQQVGAFLYAICLNTAQDETARARCLIVLDGSRK